MDRFSIRDIENLCGVKAHTLRIWEQRYKLCVAKRKESHHRIYDCNDLKELLQVAFLYHNGYKISRIAALSPEQIQEEVAKIKPQCCNYEGFVHRLIDAGLRFDEAGFEKIVDGLISRIGLEKSMLNVFYPFLQRIGLLWMTNHVIPAQEHFSSHIIRQKIIAAIDSLETVKEEPGQPNIIVFSPSGELHEIPLLVVNYLLKKRGIRTTYFGTNVCMETLQFYNSERFVSHFYLHVITHLDNCAMDKFICSLCRNFPDKVVMVSGPACHCVQTQPANLVRLNSIEDLLGQDLQPGLLPEKF